jgi:hypothetical protein
VRALPLSPLAFTFMLELAAEARIAQRCLIDSASCAQSSQAMWLDRRSSEPL